MTSEVVVMNRLGIALASDSAATVYTADGRPKVYQADKLFMLSRRHPVGVMIYNNSALLGVPWETILKMFRRELGDRCFPRLEDYSAELIKFLNNAPHLFPAEVQRDHYLYLVETLFRGIRKGIERELFSQVTSGKSGGKRDSRKDDRKEAARIIQESREKWRKEEDAKCYPPDTGAILAGESSDVINLKVREVFKPWDLEAAEVAALHELAALVVSKSKILDESLSGLVIAGFGEDQHFPVMQSFALGEIFRDRLKYNELATKAISSSVASVVEPFAQSDMVDAFLSGISPPLQVKFMRELAKLIVALPDAVIDEIPRLSKETRALLKTQLRPRSIELFKKFYADLAEYRESMHSDPILQSIEFLPKNELAHVAASLVNLNSFQKRMSFGEDETVGGPIDVAVISKGDGFVWIDRKHYFRPDLNHHFFSNYGFRPPPGKSQNGAEKAAPDSRNPDENC